VNIWCWHGQTDTLPRVRKHPRGASTVEVVIPIGLSVQLDPGQPAPDVTVLVEATTGPGGALETYSNSREITPAFVQALFDDAAAMRGQPGGFEPVRPYLDISAQLAATSNRYYEVTIAGLPYGDTFTYQVKYQVNTTSGYGNGPQPNNTQPHQHTVVLLDPEFTAADIQWVQTPNEDIQHWWTLSHKTERGYDCLRLDMLTTVYAADRYRLPCVKLSFPDGATVDIGAVQANPTPMPIINRNADTILVCRAQQAGASLASVGVTTGFDPSYMRFQNVDLTVARSYWPTRLLLLNYCIQGLNDLMAPPLDAYIPPRTYIQVTMSDELSKYGSRPEQTDSGLPDGYSLTLAAHRYYNVKSEWAFNAGVLTMIAHDTPDELLRLRDDVLQKRLIPCNAGFGAHRPPYYKRQTNARELQYGQQVIQTLLQYNGPGVNVYYPDQRLFKGLPDELDAYADAGIQYLVFDRSTVCSGPLNNSTAFFQGNNEFNGNCLWTLTGKNIGLLLIEDRFRDDIDGSSPDERDRGKMALSLRRRFMQLITDSAGGNKRPLMVYGDDADKASGNGWFDGDYGPNKVHYNEEYQADLCWISGHPWVQSITTEDLVLARDSAGNLDVTSATCPSVDPGGAITVDKYGNNLHFDQWYRAWQNFRAVWLDRTLDQLSGELESALIGWAGSQTDELYQLAWMYFLMFTHESFWNKEPLEGDRTNDYQGVLEPEDFVIAESLEQRHAWVYLNASVWAAMSTAQLAGGPFLDEDPLLSRLVTANFAPRPAALPSGVNGLFWDHDLLQNVILYNDQVLVVMDRNGGWITNVFVRTSGNQVLSVSGHFKCFQYLDTSRTVGTDPGTISDGEVFQNTVYTPNHAGVAADVNQATPLVGTYYDPRQKPGPEQQWYYPNNFNEYDYSASGKSAVFSYQPRDAVPPALLNRDTFRQACIDDRTRRVGGQPGLVWHDPATPQFTKTISLQNRILKVSYQQVPPGHIVSNEFCLDLFTAVLQAQYQSKVVAADKKSISLNGPRASGVTVRLGNNCEFSAAALTASIAAAQVLDNVSDYLDLHRVLTDNLQVECPLGGSFDYEIEFA
jgi:hypothetical protein